MFAKIFKLNFINIVFLTSFFGLVFLFDINSAKADFAVCGITPTSPLWQAKASDGTVVLTVDSAGNLDIIAATVQTNATIPQTGISNSFIIKNSSANRSVFNKTNAYIAGSILESQASLPAASGDDLVVKNSVGTALALFDATTGNIYLKGKSCGATIKIYNCTDLQNMKSNLSGSYELANNINCSDTVNWNGGKGFEPIGSSSPFFTGKLDGNNFIISNLYINRAESKLGLFSITKDSAIKNIGLTNVNYYIDGN